MTAPDPEGIERDGAPRIVVYWRSGCGFCAMLRRQLRKAGIATEERNIWDDPAAAAFVRRHANGNETVPTVDVAGTVMVNPSVRQVAAAARQAGIELPDAASSTKRGGRKQR